MPLDPADIPIPAHLREPFTRLCDAMVQELVKVPEADGLEMLRLLSITAERTREKCESKRRCSDEP